MWAQRHAGAPWGRLERSRILAARDEIIALAAIAAVILGLVPLLASCAAPEASTPAPATVGCVDNPYAQTQAAQQGLSVAQQADMAVRQARYGLAAGLGGMIGIAQQGLGVLQSAQAARRTATPCPPDRRPTS
jgi:hypothetical protein